MIGRGKLAFLRPCGSPRRPSARFSRVFRGAERGPDCDAIRARRCRRPAARPPGDALRGRSPWLAPLVAGRSLLAAARSACCCARGAAGCRTTTPPSARCTTARCRASADSRSGPGFFPVALLRPPPVPGRPRGWLVAWARGRRGVAARRLARRAPGARASPCTRSRRSLVAAALSRPDAATGLAAAGARGRGSPALAIVWSRQSLQLHGRQRRPRGGDGRSCGFARVRRRRARGRRAGALPASRSPRRRCRSSPSTCRRRGCSWATSARCRWASSPRRSASPASRAGTWPAWFPLLVFLPFVADATVTLARRARARRARLARRTGRITTSGCTSWAPGTAERSPSTAC